MANITVTVQDGNNILLELTPPTTQTIKIDRGVAGAPGPPGPNTIGGYSINVSGAENYDALMFLENEWVNIPQVEITDGGNF